MLLSRNGVLRVDELDKLHIWFTLIEERTQMMLKFVYRQDWHMARLYAGILADELDEIRGDN